ncbi:MAG: UbiA family prenyltransferase [Chloroflexales bacterium]|nr:UbiA family prenyltransferase [Chloroflexales bacterium]
MTVHARGSVSPLKSIQRALIHLRLAFSLVLTPLFLWGVYLARPGPIAWGHVLAAYLIVHVLLYGGMNAFNSYYDRDEGPIGSLLEPPPIDRTVLIVALIAKAAALLMGLILDLRFGLLVGLGVIFSVAYSHPRWRWKERPLYAAIFVFVGQGVLGVLWGWAAATSAEGSLGALATRWPWDGLKILAVLSAACWTLGFYPLTGVYQIDADGQRGIRTLAVALGPTGCFVFAAVVASIGGLGIWVVLLIQGAYLVMAISALYMLGAAVYTWRWYHRCAALTPRDNQRILMRLSYTNGLVFSVLFLSLVLA